MVRNGSKARLVASLMIIALFMVIFASICAYGVGWTRIELVSTETAPNSFSPSLAVDPDGNVHVAWSSFADYGGAGAYDSDIFYRQRSSHYGWVGTTELVSSESTGYSVYSSLAVGSDGTVHIAWVDKTDYDGSGTDWDIFYKNRTIDGIWSPTELVSKGSTEDSHSVSLAVGPDGKVHIAWYDGTPVFGGPDEDILYRRYVPRTGWGPIEVVSEQSTERSYSPSLAVGSDGTVHIAWVDKTDYDGSGTDPFFNDYIFYKSRLPSGSWTTREVVTTERSESLSLAVGPDGTVHIAYTVDAEDVPGYPPSNYDVFYNKRVRGSGWTTPYLVSTESPYRSAEPSLDVISGSTVYISWAEWRGYILPVGATSDIFLTRFNPMLPGPIEVISTESISASHGPSLAVGPDEKVHVVWTDYTDFTNQWGDYNSAEVFYKGMFECQNGYFKIMVEGAEGYPRMILGAQDPVTGEQLWAFEGEFEGESLGDGRIQYVVPFNIAETLPSNEEVSLFVEASDWSGTITEFSVTCLSQTYTSADPPVAVSVSEPGVASVDFTTPLYVATSTGSGNAVFMSSSGRIVALRDIAEDSLPLEGKPDGVEFPHGLFSFTIVDLTPGETVTLSISFPDPVPIGTEYWKCHEGEDPQWFSLPVSSDDGDCTIEISLTDGGVGDWDGVANGVIVDPGGLGLVVSSDAISQTEVSWIDVLILLAVLAIIGVIVIIIFFLERKG